MVNSTITIVIKQQKCRAHVVVVVVVVVAVKTKPCVVGAEQQQQQGVIMRLAGLPPPQVILLKAVAAVAATLSQVTGPLSSKPVVTGAPVAQVWGHGPARLKGFFFLVKCESEPEPGCDET